jgi:hypothetical protein
MGRIFASYSVDKGLLSTIHKELQKSSTKRINTPNKYKENANQNHTEIPSHLSE